VCVCACVCVCLYCNEVMEDTGIYIPQAKMRDVFKLQILRAIGVSIVKHGSARSVEWICIQVQH
jgi:hypothetical protein